MASGVNHKSQKSKIIDSAGEIIIGDDGRPVADKCTMHNLPEPGQNINILIIVSGCQKSDLEFWPKFKSEDQVVLSMFPNYDEFHTCRPV